jgi:hypothetical protein
MCIASIMQTWYLCLFHTQVYCIVHVCIFPHVTQKCVVSLFPLSPTDPLKSRRVKKNYCPQKNRNFRKIDARSSRIGYTFSSQTLRFKLFRVRPDVRSNFSVTWDRQNAWRWPASLLNFASIIAKKKKS